MAVCGLLQKIQKFLLCVGVILAEFGRESDRYLFVETADPVQEGGASVEEALFPTEMHADGYMNTASVDARCSCEFRSLPVDSGYNVAGMTQDDHSRLVLFESPAAIAVVHILDRE